MQETSGESTDTTTGTSTYSTKHQVFRAWENTTPKICSSNVVMKAMQAMSPHTVLCYRLHIHNHCFWTSSHQSPFMTYHNNIAAAAQLAHEEDELTYT